MYTNSPHGVCLTRLFSFASSGRLGPMVTVTLKLGISILNGGNVLVQQVQMLADSDTVNYSKASYPLPYILNLIPLCGLYIL